MFVLPLEHSAPAGLPQVLHPLGAKSELVFASFNECCNLWRDTEKEQPTPYKTCIDVMLFSTVRLRKMCFEALLQLILRICLFFQKVQISIMWDNNEPDVTAWFPWLFLAKRL